MCQLGKYFPMIHNRYFCVKLDACEDDEIASNSKLSVDCRVIQLMGEF